MSALFLLYEFASGYALLHVKEWEQIGQDSGVVEEVAADSGRFSQVCSLKAFHPFSDAEEALRNITAIGEGTVTEELQNFLESNLPKKKSKYSLGVIDITLAKALSDLEFPTVHDKNIVELFRGVRLHFPKITSGLKEMDIERARVGLAHSYSRSLMRLDPNRQDKPIMQAIALTDTMDKSNNLFAMRAREWYAWHFPELSKIVSDNDIFMKAAYVIGDRNLWENSKFEELVEAVGSEEVAEEIRTAMKTSMGQDVSDADMNTIMRLCLENIELSKTRTSVCNYMGDKLDIVAPNLRALVGDTIAARLISHSGSLVNLAKSPASTIQILGAEKALFRALKTKGNTPKYGLLFQTSAISRAAAKNKGRISRCLANKCAVAARIDAFSDAATKVFGQKLKEQVDERLTFLAEGVAPRKNIEVMREAVTMNQQ